MAEAIVYTSMCEELPKGTKVRGRLLDDYVYMEGLQWMKVKLPNGNYRTVLIGTPIKKSKEEKRKESKKKSSEKAFIKNLFNERTK